MTSRLWSDPGENVRLENDCFFSDPGENISLENDCFFSDSGLLSVIELPHK
jgi:hypothetical protein